MRRPANGRPRSRLQMAMVPNDATATRSEEHTSELQSRLHLVCRLLLEKKKKREGPLPDQQPSPQPGHLIQLDADAPAAPRSASRHARPGEKRVPPVANLPPYEPEAVVS